MMMVIMNKTMMMMTMIMKIRIIMEIMTMMLNDIGSKFLDVVLYSYVNSKFNHYRTTNVAKEL